MVILGFSLMSYQPHCTFSGVAGSTKCFDAPLSWASVCATGLKANAAAAQAAADVFAEGRAWSFICVPFYFDANFDGLTRVRFCHIAMSSA
jgi:hypothetical protein